MKRIILSLLAAAGATAAEPSSVLLVLTNHGELGETGRETGFYLSEAAHPYEVFREAGLEVEIVSPEGGFAPVDPESMQLDDEANEAFWNQFGGESDGVRGVANTTAVSKIEPGDYEGIFFAGGHGAMWDFPTSTGLRALTAGIYSRGGVVGAVCHGPAALVNLLLPDQTPLVRGKKVAVFTNSEEKAVGMDETVPFLLQTALEELGADVETAGNFSKNAIRDGRLVTGQNPASARKAARLFVEALESAQGGGDEEG